MQVNAGHARVFGHLGEWLQGRQGPNGPVVLVTLPCKLLFAQALMTKGPDLTLQFSGPKAVTRDQLKKLLRAGGKPETGHFDVTSNVPAGVGAGSSTAVLIALARAAGINEDHLPAACLDVEKATDPLMLAEPDKVLWSSRTARIVAHYRAPPPCEIVGGYFGDPIKTDADDSDFADISDLLPAWLDTTNRADLAQIATLASEAARRTTLLRGPSDDPSPALVQRFGALGYARAHTGSARAFIFAPGTVPSNVETLLARAGITGAFRFLTGSMS